MKTNLTTLFTEFFESEQASGVILIVCTLAAIVMANSPLGKGFVDFWHLKVGVDIGSALGKHSCKIPDRDLESAVTSRLPLRIGEIFGARLYLICENHL